VPIAAAGGPNVLRCDIRNYWITSAAVANSVSGMVRPSALARLRLMAIKLGRLLDWDMRRD